MTEPLPCSPACERNREPILACLRQRLEAARDVLEIGSGTGQHAVHFAAALPAVRWHTSDLEDNHPAIQAWIDEAGLDNVIPPLALDVRRAGDWPDRCFDAVFSANTSHIMSWSSVEAMFRGIKGLLPSAAPFLLYGPFNRDGQFTSPGNRSLDAWARERFPGGGLRDHEAMTNLGVSCGLDLMEDCAMPSNNRMLVFRRRAADQGVGN